MDGEKEESTHAQEQEPGVTSTWGLRVGPHPIPPPPLPDPQPGPMVNNEETNLGASSAHGKTFLASVDQGTESPPPFMFSISPHFPPFEANGTFVYVQNAQNKTGKGRILVKPKQSPHTLLQLPPPPPALDPPCACCGIAG